MNRCCCKDCAGGIPHTVDAWIERAMKAEALVRQHVEADRLWEAGPLRCMKRAEELLKAGPFDNVDHAAAAGFVSNWLAVAEYPEEPDTDGSTGQGWRVKNHGSKCDYVVCEIAPEWTVLTKGSKGGPEFGGRLGMVSWFTSWRCYAFWPADGSLYESRCLRDIADFCAWATSERKAERAAERR